MFNIETDIEPYASQNTVYGSSERDEAMILETLLLMHRNEAALQQARKVSRNLADEERFNTQSTAFSLMALGRLAAAKPCGVSRSIRHRQQETSR